MNSFDADRTLTAVHRLSRRALALCLLATTVHAGVIHVPEDQATIQSGLNAAAGDDTVKVAPGEYNETLFWPFVNGITLMGSGMDSTFVVGDQVKGVMLVVGESVEIDSTTVIRDLRLRNGGDSGLVLFGASPIVEACAVDSTRAGPGILCLEGSRGLFRGCRVENNLSAGIAVENGDSMMRIEQSIVTTNQGTGIACGSSSPIISGNTISANSISGITCSGNASPTLTGNQITANTTFDGGGGLDVDSGSPMVIANVFSENTADYGGAIHMRENSATITGNTFIGNESSASGGAIACNFGSGALISDNVIVGNHAGSGGGIYFVIGSNDTVLDNIIVANMATGSGGGMFLENSGPTIAGNAIVENEATGSGGGILCGNGSPSITNNTLARNVARQDGGAVSFSGPGDESASFLSNAVTENRADGRGDGIFTEQSEPLIETCNIAFNGWGLYNITVGDVPTAQNNWWGDPSGPWHQGANPEGQGDSLSLYAWDFIPWLAEADTVVPPYPPLGLAAEADTVCCVITLTWEAVLLPDLTGYRIHYDTDAPGFPYTETVDAGNTTLFELSEGLEPETTYYMAVTCMDSGGEESWFSREVAVETGSGTTSAGSPPHGGALWLAPVQPNPFTGATTIAYILPSDTPVRIAIYDARGRRVRQVARKLQTAGSHRVVWDARDDRGVAAVSGVFFVRLDAGGHTLVTKAVLRR